MKFKVGDRVKIREDLMTGKTYGKESFVDFMEKYRGKMVTIKAVFAHYYEIEEDIENWSWTDEMFDYKKEYTYEDLKKSPIGTKITFENGEVLVKDEEDYFENVFKVREIKNLHNLKDNYLDLGKIIKIEEPEYKTVYGSKQEILDEAEKRYLRGVIRPFRDKVKTIEKYIYSGGNASIDICTESSNSNWVIELQPFPKNKIYKNMEDNKKYTLEELGL